MTTTWIIYPKAAEGEINPVEEAYQMLTGEALIPASIDFGDICVAGSFRLDADTAEYLESYDEFWEVAFTDVNPLSVEEA